MKINQFNTTMLKIRKPMIISITAKKEFNKKRKIQYPFVVKTLNKITIKGFFLNLMSTKTHNYIILIVEP